MKSSKIISAFCTVSLIAGLIIAFFVLLNEEFDVTKDTVNTEIKYYSYNTDGIHDILIDAAYSNISIKKSSDNQIHIQYGENPRLNYKIAKSSSALSIKQYSSDRIFFSVHKYKCIISIPENYSGNIKMSCSANNISADGLLKLNNFSVKTTAGNINITNINAKSLYIQSTVGNTNISNTVTDKNFSIETTVGNIKINRIFSKNIILKSTAGNISGYISGDLNKFSIQSRTSAGKSNLADKNSGIYRLNTETTVGNIKIGFKK